MPFGEKFRARLMKKRRCRSSRKKRFGIRRAFSLVAPGEEYFGGRMSKLIEFYIPQSFRKVSRWLPPKERGKLLEFPVAVRKSA